MSEILEQLQALISDGEWACLHPLGTTVKLRYQGRIRYRARYICEILAGVCPRARGAAIMDMLEIDATNYRTWSITQRPRALVLRDDTGQLSPWRSSSTLVASGGDTIDAIHRNFRRPRGKTFQGVSGIRLIGNPANAVCPY